MMKTNSATANSFDIMVANTLGITVEEWHEAIEYIDEEDVGFITNKLISLDEDEINEGIKFFKRI